MRTILSLTERRGTGNLQANNKRMSHASHALGIPVMRLAEFHDLSKCVHSNTVTDPNEGTRSRTEFCCHIVSQK